MLRQSSPINFYKVIMFGMKPNNFWIVSATPSNPLPSWAKAILENRAITNKKEAEKNTFFVLIFSPQPVELPFLILYLNLSLKLRFLEYENVIATFKYRNIKNTKIVIRRGNKNEKNEQKRHSILICRYASGINVSYWADNRRSCCILFGKKRHYTDKSASDLIILA